jgi:hypothetical protein
VQFEALRNARKKYSHGAGVEAVQIVARVAAEKYITIGT